MRTHIPEPARYAALTLILLVSLAALIMAIANEARADDTRRDHGFYITGGAGWTDYADFDADGETTATDDSWAAMIGAGYQFRNTPFAAEIRGTYARHLAPDGVQFLPELDEAAVPVTRIQACGFWTPDIGLTIHPYAGPCIGAGFLGVDPIDRDAVPVGEDHKAVNVADIGLAVDLIAGAKFGVTRDGRLQIGPEFGIGWVPLASRKGVDHEDESMEWRALLTVTYYP
jgi:hypothetical protein